MHNPGTIPLPESDNEIPITIQPETHRTGAMLIDLKNDLHETTNLVKQARYAPVVQRLSSLVTDYVDGHTPQEADF